MIRLQHLSPFFKRQAQLCRMAHSHRHRATSLLPPRSQLSRWVRRARLNRAHFGSDPALAELPSELRRPSWSNPVARLSRRVARASRHRATPVAVAQAAARPGVADPRPAATSSGRTQRPATCDHTWPSITVRVWARDAQLLVFIIQRAHLQPSSRDQLLTIF